MRRLVVLALAAATFAVPQAAEAAPPPVQNLAAYQLGGAPVHLQWTTPPGTDGVSAALLPGDQPPGAPADGTAIPLANAQAHAATIHGLAPASVYSVAVWTQTGGTYSDPATTTFTTEPLETAAVTHTVTVTVTDTAGNPLTGATVYADDATLDRHTRTGPDGTATLALPAGRYQVGAGGGTGGATDATGYGFHDVPVTVAGDTSTTLQLPEGGAITGTVTDLAGHPLPHVKVTYSGPEPYVSSDSGDAVAISYVTTNPPHSAADGTFALTGQSGPAFIPCFTKVGYARRCATRAIVPVVGKVRDIGTVALSRVTQAAQGTLAGSVTGPDGRQLDRAYLELRRATRFSAPHLVPIGRDGSFRTRIAPGRWRACASISSFGQAGLGNLPVCRTITVLAAVPTRLDLVLPTGGALSGRALSPTGVGVPNADVDVSTLKGVERGFGSTDADGFFTAGGLPTGRYRICFSGDNSATQSDPTGVAGRCLLRDVRVGRDRIGADVTLGPGAAATGVVTTSDGRPVRHADVTYEQANGDGFGYSQTDRNGRYRVTDLASGDYFACVDVSTSLFQYRHRCRHDTVRTVTGSTTTADIAFPALPTIHVLVTDRSGHPLAGVEVAAVRNCRSFECDPIPLLGAQKVAVDGADMTDTRGRMTLTGRTRGTYSVCAFAYYAASQTPAPATGFGDRCTTRQFDLQAGSPKYVHLRLGPGGTVTGRITDGHGHGLKGVRIHLPGSPVDDTRSRFFGYDRVPSPYADSVTDADGRYTLHSVRPGSGSLCARHAGAHAPACLVTPVTVRAGRVTTAPTLALRSGPTAAATARSVVRAQRTARPRVAERVMIVDGVLARRSVTAGR